MSEKIKVLWFEDEYEKMDNFLTLARGEGLELIPFRSADEGIEELQKNYAHYDAVLMDAQFFMSKDDTVQNEGVPALARAKTALEMLAEKKKFDVFVFTGQAKYYGDKMFESFVGKYYRKGFDADQLLRDIKESANKHRDTQIRHKYHRVFEACSEEHLGDQTANRLLHILKNQDTLNSEDFLNSLRKIIETLFKSLHQRGLVPIEFVDGKDVALNMTCRFLIGEAQMGYQLNRESRLPKAIAFNLWSVLNHCQTASHDGYIDEHIQTLKTTYLFNSLTFLLMDVIIWYKAFVDSDPKPRNWLKEVKTSSIVDNGFVKYIKRDSGGGLIIVEGTREKIKISKNEVERFHLKEKDKVEVTRNERVNNIAFVLNQKISKIKKRN